MPIEELFKSFGHSESSGFILTNLEFLTSLIIDSDKNLVTNGVLNPAPISSITNFLLVFLILFKNAIN